MVAIRPKEGRRTTTTEELGGVIPSMMSFSDGYWLCIQCGKMDNNNTNITTHIEAKHLEGLSHPFNYCTM